MELGFKKRNRLDRTMRSKSFDTQEVREIESRRVERFSHRMDRNNRKGLPDRRKGMQRPGKIENMLEKIQTRARKMP